MNSVTVRSVMLHAVTAQRPSPVVAIQYLELDESGEPVGGMNEDHATQSFFLTGVDAEPFFHGDVAALADQALATHVGVLTKGETLAAKEKELVALRGAILDIERSKSEAEAELAGISNRQAAAASALAADQSEKARVEADLEKARANADAVAAEVAEKLSTLDAKIKELDDKEREAFGRQLAEPALALGQV